MEFIDLFIWFIQDGKAIKEDFYNSGQRIVCINENDLIKFYDLSLLIFKLSYTYHMILIDDTLEYLKIEDIRPKHIERLKIKINNDIKKSLNEKYNENCEINYNTIFSQYDRLADILIRLNNYVFKINV